MLRITEIPLKNETLANLAAFQAEVNLIPVDTEWKKNLDAIWKKHSNSSEFDDVKEKLGQMCPGRKRCCYCEDSEAEGIDHIAPKVHFPDLTFSWANYLYACAICNKKKSDTYAIFVTNGSSRTFNKIPRYKHKPGVSRNFHSNSDPGFISPRECDPTDFLELVIDPKFDKVDFYPIVATLSSQDQIRADFTINTLKLNSTYRPNLAKSRMDAYRDFFDRLNTYVQRKVQDKWPQNMLDNIVLRFKKRNHSSVWFEIKRCQNDGKLRNVDPEFANLFAQAPEALSW